MLFVLRLLPPFKKWEARIICIAMGLNFAITILGTVSYGVSCIPFRANWQIIPGAKCYSKDLLVITTRVNGGKYHKCLSLLDSLAHLSAVLACVIDIITAAIPQFLLWKVQMARRTKIILNCLFGLGIVTAALSIGRTVALSRSAMEVDSSCKSI